MDDSAASALAPAPVTVVVVGGSAAGSEIVRGQIETIAASFAGRVAVRACSQGALAAEHPSVHAVWPGGEAPGIVVLRAGAIVGQAVGAHLPAHELGRLIGRAVE